MDDLNMNVFSAFTNDWPLVTAGVEGDYNTMTIGWGGLGTLWSRPVATVYVKQNRYTHQFMEKNGRFTVSFFPPEYKAAMGYLGSHSGKDEDKVAAAGLTPVYLDGAVTFKEASLTLVCEKIYAHSMDTSAMPDDVAATYYEDEPPHTMFVGQVVDILR